MKRPFSRREFVSSTALAAAALPLRPRHLLERLTSAGEPEPSGSSGRAPSAGRRARRAGVHLPAEAIDKLAVPFDLSNVRLRPGPILDALEVDRRYMLGLDPDRLLHMFRVTAGLPSSAEPLGGWEAPDNELRGHFTGHYLSACAMMAAHTGDPAVRARGEHMIGELATCQAAHGNGYLSAFPEELFDRLREDRRVWAPFYTLHKIMAGLLDSYTLLGNRQALDVLNGMAGWVAGWVQPLGDEAMARVLEREYGGMNETLYNLSAATGERRWMWLAHRFDHERFFAPLAAGRDELRGLHVNTHIPQVIGAARRYELTGERRYHDIASYFWHTVTERRAYATGGTSNGEGWDADPGILSTQLSGYTQESCTSYNMLKLSRHLFQWTADPRVADYYERAYLNGIIGTQHPRDGEKIYYTPLASGYWKLFGTMNQDFWCCTGSMTESFAKLGDSIWFHDDDGVWVNLFIPSEVQWPEKGVRLVQETRFPEEDTIRLTVHAAKPVRMPLRVRVPYWTSEDASASLNGKRLDGFAAPGSYWVLDRTWRDGDRVEITLPQRLHIQPTPDDPTVQAVMYGPLVLAGKLGTAGLTPQNIRAEPTKPRTIPEYRSEPVPAPSIVAKGDDPTGWVAPVPGKPLEFRTVGQAGETTLVPLDRLFDERYVVYWKVGGTPA